MKNKIRKPLAAFGLLGILLVITGIVVFVASIYSFGVRSQQKNTLKLEGAVNTLRQISENQDAVFQNQSKFSDNRLENLAIKSKANPRIFILAVYE